MLTGMSGEGGCVYRWAKSAVRPCRSVLFRFGEEVSGDGLVDGLVFGREGAARRPAGGGGGCVGGRVLKMRQSDPRARAATRDGVIYLRNTRRKNTSCVNSPALS